MTPETPGNATAATERLRIAHDPDGTITLHGEVDLATAPELRRALETAIGARPESSDQTMVDLRGLSYLDSAGVSALYDHAHRLHLLVDPDSAVAVVVRISGLSLSATVEPRPRP